MEQNILSEATNHSGSQEISSPLYNPKSYYRVHKGQPLFPILNQI